ncbi:MAG: hypothetical protein R3C19_12220 [Planctomycetaceae bacterium]
MKPDFYQLMMADRHHNEVLRAAAGVSDFELETAAGKIPDDQIAHIAMYVLTRCRSVGIQQVLIFGGLLTLFEAAVSADDRRELFQNMIEDLGISRTQAYRCRLVWCRFGAELVGTPQLGKFFVAESLKILAEDRSPEPLRSEALDLARQGTPVTIRVAKALQKKHGVDVDDKRLPAESRRETPARSRARSSRPSWLFRGSVVRIRLEATTRSEATGIDEVIRDLEAVIAELRRRGTGAMNSDAAVA